MLTHVYVRFLIELIKLILLGYYLMSMAKIKHNSSFHIFKEISTVAKERGIAHLNDTRQNFDGKYYIVNGKKLLNFGYCGYLGLEMDTFLKSGAHKAIDNQGLQYGVSRAYVTSNTEQNLVSLLSKIFDNNPVIVHSSTSSAHIANLPNLLEHSDAIVLDQQVHFSVQTAAQLCGQNGVKIEMIRHNNLEMLERRYYELVKTNKRVWYMIDGVYSMYGDLAPFGELQNLLNKLPNLYLYIDDAHGVSWSGEFGCGIAFSRLGSHPKTVFNVTMGKAFGVTGGVSIFPNREFYERVKLFGGPYTYSHPLSPAIMGAAIYSAKIHLSSRITQLQWDLKQRIDYCNGLLKETNLPILSSDETPIFFVGVGQPSVNYNVVSKLLKRGFYVNAALFPAVSVKCSGIRFSITRHNSFEEIKSLVNTIKEVFPLALKEEGKSYNDVRRAFKMPLIDKQFNDLQKILNGKDKEFNVFVTDTIKQIEKNEWNKKLGEEGVFDYLGCSYLETVFQNNQLPEENFEFKYIIIRDEHGEIVLATFLTIGILKDDFLAQESISKQVENKRKYDKYYLTSKAIMLGSQMSAGNHLYISGSVNRKQELINLLVKEIEKIKEETAAKCLILRDFDEDQEVSRIFQDLGFVKTEMPNMNVINKPIFESIENFMEGLNKYKRRYHFKKDVLPFIQEFETTSIEKLTNDEVELAYQLFLDVKRINYGINFYDYPKKFIREMNNHPNWEFLKLRLPNEEGSPIASIVMCYKTKTSFHPMFVGLNYNYLNSHKVYKQMLFQCIKRASDLKAEKLFFGYSADLEKRKLGATQVPKVAFVQYEDNFNLEVLETIGAYQN